MSWWLAGLDIQSTKKYNLAARWLLRQSGVVRQRGEEFDPADLTYQQEVKMPNATTGDEEVIIPEDPLSGINKLLNALEEMTGRTALDKRGELRHVVYLELKRRGGERISEFTTRFRTLVSEMKSEGVVISDNELGWWFTSYRKPMGAKQAMVSEVDEQPEETADEPVEEAPDPPSLEEVLQSEAEILATELEEAAADGLDAETLNEVEESVEAAAEAFLTMKEARTKLQEVRKDRGYGKPSTSGGSPGASKVSLKKQSDKRPCFDCGLPGHWAGDPECQKPGQQLGRKKGKPPVKQVKVTETMNTEHTDPDGSHEVLTVLCSPQKLTADFETAFNQSHMPKEVNLVQGLTKDKRLVGALDSACNRTCTGCEWLSSYLTCLRESALKAVLDLVLVEDENETFRFGNGGCQKSSQRWRLPTMVGGVVLCFWTSVVDVPSLGLLLGRDFLEAVGAVMNFSKKLLHCELLGAAPIRLRQLSAGHFFLGLLPERWPGLGPQRWRKLGVDGVVEIQMSASRWLHSRFDGTSRFVSQHPDGHDHFLTESSLHFGNLVCSVLADRGSAVQASMPRQPARKPSRTTSSSRTSTTTSLSADDDAKRPGDPSPSALAKDDPSHERKVNNVGSKRSPAVVLAKVLFALSAFALPGNLDSRHLAYEADKFTFAHLSECIQWRNRIGLDASFCEDPVLQGFKLAKAAKGLSQKVKSAALAEAQTKAQEAAAAGELEQQAKGDGKKPTLAPFIVESTFYKNLKSEASGSRPPENVPWPQVQAMQKNFHAALDRMALEMQELRNARWEQMTEPSLIAGTEMGCQVGPDGYQAGPDMEELYKIDPDFRAEVAMSLEQDFEARLAAQYGEGNIPFLSQEEREVEYFEEMNAHLNEEPFVQVIDLSKNIHEALANEHNSDPTRPFVAEVFTNSRNVMKEAMRRGHVVGSAMSLENGWNFLRRRDREEALRRLQKEKPYCVVLAFPCGSFSPLQYLNSKSRMTWPSRMSSGRILMNFALRVENMDEDDEVPNPATPGFLPSSSATMIGDGAQALHGDDLPPAQAKELLPIMIPSTPAIPSQVGSTIPSRRMSGLESVSPFPDAVRRAHERRVSEPVPAGAPERALPADASDGGGTKRAAETDAEQLRREDVDFGTVPGSSSEALQADRLPGEEPKLSREQLQHLLQQPNLHPLSQAFYGACLDQLDPLESEVKDHGTWSGRWGLPSRSEWQTFQRLGMSWPTGAPSDHEVQAAQATRKEFHWKQMSAEEKEAFTKAAKEAWSVWEENDAIEILSEEESAMVRKPCGKWSYVYNPTYVKQPKKKKVSGAVSGIVPGVANLCRSPGWHQREGFVVHVAFEAKSFRIPDARYGAWRFPLRTTYGRFDLADGRSVWRLLEENVELSQLPKKQDLLERPAGCLITVFKSRIKKEILGEEACLHERI
ncbi:Ankyrin-3 [Durusdinium trenchii]|uniref:Ankyrin-3 n=1 Tax=Durusdinium trenchii TaxID=1381693 RepID=A0ABP0IJQ5_9DINO